MNRYFKEDLRIKNIHAKTQRATRKDIQVLYVVFNILSLRPLRSFYFAALRGKLQVRIIMMNHDYLSVLMLIASANFVKSEFWCLLFFEPLQE